MREIALFVVAGVCEVGGGWFVWQALRTKKPHYWLFFGFLLLCVYGVFPTLQQSSNFGRLYAVYGGFFIVLSLLWGWGINNSKPDIGDAIGCMIALIGVLVMLYYPRPHGSAITPS